VFVVPVMRHSLVAGLPRKKSLQASLLSAPVQARSVASLQPLPGAATESRQTAVTLDTHAVSSP
jgi:hypothetical protein